MSDDTAVDRPATGAGDPLADRDKPRLAFQAV